MKKKSNKQRLKEKLWRLTSEYVRRKDADHAGYVSCYTCGKVKHWKEGDAGHAIGGRHNAVLFDLSILRFQCKECNGPGKGMYYEFGTKLNQENGDGWYEQKKIEAKTTVKFTESDYEDMIEDIEQKLRGLE